MYVHFPLTFLCCRILEGPFQRDRVFTKAFQKAYEEVANHSPRAAEYLSLFIDDRLRKGVKVRERIIMESR
jgi:hypothetical protein